jgi:hypothetical protein
MVRCHDTEILTPSFSRSALDEEVGLSERLEGRADGVFHVSWLRINLGWVVSSFYDVDSEIAIARERERIPSYHIAPLYMLHVCYICVAYGNIVPYWAKWYASGERWDMEPFQSPMGWCGVEVGPFRQHGTRQWAASEIPPHRCGALVSLWDRMMIMFDNHIWDLIWDHMGWVSSTKIRTFGSDLRSRLQRLRSHLAVGIGRLRSSHVDCEKCWLYDIDIWW